MLILFLMLVIIVMIFHGFFTIVQNIIYKIKINTLLEDVNTKEDLLYMRLKDFQNVIAEVLKRKNYKVRFTDKCGEEGKGLVLNNIQYVEMCKHSLNRMVEVEAAMKLAKCMQVNSIYRGMFITLGDFKKNTKMFCHKNVIECINGDQLLKMCKEVQKKKEVLETS